MFGHIPIKAPIVESLHQGPEASCLFLGPHSYIPPEWLREDDWVPTWNFTSVKIVGAISLSKKTSRESVQRLTEHMQKDSLSDWSLEKVEHRMGPLLSKIIGFKMNVDKISPRFKLGQDETPENLAKIRSQLRGHEILNWM